MTGKHKRSHHDRQAVGCEFRPPQFSSPREAWFGEISIHLYICYLNFTSKMRIPTTLKIDGSRSPVTDSAVTPSFDESRKNAGGKWGGFFSRLMCRRRHTTVVSSLNLGLSIRVELGSRVKLRASRWDHNELGRGNQHPGLNRLIKVKSKYSRG